MTPAPIVRGRLAVPFIRTARMTVLRGMGFQPVLGEPRGSAT
jgi:hypothetical protein